MKESINSFKHLTQVSEELENELISKVSTDYYLTKENSYTKQIEFVKKLIG